MRFALTYIAIVVAIAFVASDSWRRSERIAFISKVELSLPLPAVDENTATGYELGMRRLILPSVGIDGCHWVMHTQQMLANDDWRIRSTDVDNAPDGREIHWSHGFIWWLVGLGEIHSSISGLPLPASVEAVSPYANTLLLVLMIAFLPWCVRWRLGNIAAGGLALAMAGVYPFFEFFLVGNADHHAIAAAGSLVCVLMIALGGAGWVAQPVWPDTDDPLPLLRPIYNYEVDLRSARWSFIVSALAASVSLWASAATAIPTLIGIAIGALISTLVFGNRRLSERTYYVPSLWRWWGFTGFCGSLFFYFLEYFPEHMGIRLEVNHPVYAFAWLGGSEWMYRVMRWRSDGIRPWRNSVSVSHRVTARNSVQPTAKSRPSISSIACLFFAFIAIVIPPALIAIHSDDCFWIADPFLWNLHQDHITEFDSLINVVPSWPFTLSMMVLSLVPLLSIVVVRMIFMRELGGSWKGILIFLWIPTLLLTALGFLQVRWLGSAHVILLPAIPVVLGCWFHKSFPRRIFILEWAVAILIAASILVYPIQSVSESINCLSHPVELSPEDLFEVYVRDLAYAVKRANRDRDPVILSSPTITTSLIYYGGMKGVGTNYWENLPGLKAAARIYGAKSESVALQAMQLHRITHLVQFASDPFGNEYVRLLRGLPKRAKIQDAFIPTMTKNREMPIWLTPILFQPPSQLSTESVLLLQVNAEQTPMKAHLEAARYNESRGDIARAIAETRSALKYEPQNRDTWLQLGRRLMLVQGDNAAKEAMENGLRDRPSDEITDLCGNAALTCFQALKHAEAAYLLRRALEATPRQPTATNALAWLLATTNDDAVRNPVEALRLAENNTSFAERVSYLHTLAAAQAANGEFTTAIETIEQVIQMLQSLDPDNIGKVPEPFNAHLKLFEAEKPIRIGIIP
ncbi:MAG: hypothetical protein SGI77_09800 [Pirellulaceae bacterium]|nr:hypothetical protein [Pirellulaceae bacterium]